ncbi:MAG: acyl carrier protein [Eubacterium sp.]|nr:acyl carrier protein [Eubacterium sp.]
MTKEEILEIAKEITPNLDWENETSLMDDGKLDSFDVVGIAGELMDRYDIEITADDVEPENFNSIDCIYNLVQRKLEED